MEVIYLTKAWESKIYHTTRCQYTMNSQYLEEVSLSSLESFPHLQECKHCIKRRQWLKKKITEEDYRALA